MNELRKSSANSSKPSDSIYLVDNIAKNAELQPFEPIWSYGFNTCTPLINLTNDKQKQIFYSVSQFGVLYDYESKEMCYLEGHPNAIKSVSVDARGKYLATADQGNDNVILVWDVTAKKLLSTIFDPYLNHIKLISISHNARYLVSVGSDDDEYWKINFWLWTYGRSEVDDYVLIKRSYGAPQSVGFSPNKNEFIIVVFEQGVVFITWAHGQFLEPTIPEINRHKEFGKLCGGAYVRESHDVVVSSVNGYLLLFGRSIIKRPFVEEEQDNVNIAYINAIKITTSINCLIAVEDVIVVGDCHGDILFFNDKLQLVHHITVSNAIISISYDIVTLLPKTDERRNLQHRSFIFISSDGNIYRGDYDTENFIPLFHPIEPNIVAIETHSDFPYLVFAYTTGKISMFNYEVHEKITCKELPPKENGDNFVIACLQYSPSCLHLACGTVDGYVWTLDPITLSAKHPFIHSTYHTIVKIAFSPTNSQMAFFDSNMTVFLYVYDTSNKHWLKKGKIRSHYESINCILFYNITPYQLCTLGSDRHLVKYDNFNIYLDTTEEMKIVFRDRIDQKDIPIYGIYYPKCGKTENCLLIADNKYKYKVLNNASASTVNITVGPSIGCFRDTPVCKMQILPKKVDDSQYLIFMNKTHIGLQLLPLDGNPYKYVGCRGDPTKIEDFRICPTGDYLFTFGKGSGGIMQWKISTDSVNQMEKMGGSELFPYYCLLEGGKSGRLFSDMYDFFIHAQILEQGENSVLPRVIDDYMHISGLTELVRACGYFPSDYEASNLMSDVRNSACTNPSGEQDTISFVEFVKLYINHKPAHGYSDSYIKNALDTLIELSNFDSDVETITREDLVETLTTAGETFTAQTLGKCLSILLQDENAATDKDFNCLPDDISYEEFSENILGLTEEVEDG